MVAARSMGKTTIIAAKMIYKALDGRVYVLTMPVENQIALLPAAGVERFA